MKLRKRATAPVAAGAFLTLTAVVGALGAPAQATAVGTAQRADADVDRHLWDDRITESSGLARSTYARPLVWTHNDSGDSARVYAIKSDGDTRAVMTLKGASAVDWEDISTGPNHTIWVGDIGDNSGGRGHVTVYRFKEPRKVTSGEVEAVRYDFAYPDGARDAEAMMVRPRTGRLFIISKVQDGGAIYRAPKSLSTSSVNKLRRVASAPGVVTAGSFAPDGKSFALVSYTRIWVYSAVGSAPRAEARKVNDSSQGESAEVGRGGKRLLLGQEGGDSPVYAVPYNAP